MAEATISAGTTDSGKPSGPLSPAARRICNALLFLALTLGGTYGLLYSHEMAGWISCEMHKSGKLCQNYKQEKASPKKRDGTEDKIEPSSGEQTLVKLIVFFCTLSLALGISQPLTLLVKYLSLKLEWSQRVGAGEKGHSALADNLPGLTVLGSAVVSVAVSISVSVENPDARRLSAQVLELTGEVKNLQTETINEKLENLTERVKDAEDNLASAVDRLQKDLSGRQDTVSGHMAALENIYAGERWESLRSNISQVVEESYEDIEKEIARKLVESDKWEKLLARRQSLEKPMADAQRLEILLKEADFEYRKCTEPHRSFLFFVSSDARKVCHEEYLKDVAAIFERLNVDSQARDVEIAQTPNVKQTTDKANREKENGQEVVSNSRQEP